MHVDRLTIEKGTTLGYYVNTINSNVKIRKSYYDGVAFDAVCELNAHDDLKRGGSFPGNEERPSDSKSAGNPNKWFSWMEWNYDETCSNLTEVLEMLGFEVWKIGYDDDFYYLGLGYDNKSGQEELFFKTLAKYIEDGSYIEWRGEDDYMYRWDFDDGVLKEHEGIIYWV